MKKKIIIIIIIVSFILIGLGICLSISKKPKKMHGGDIPEGTAPDNYMDTMFKWAQEIYDSKEYEKYSIRNEYYISLEDLKNDFHYDTSGFIDDTGAVCDGHASAIHYPQDNPSEFWVSLDGCTNYYE